ncbi:MAG TPA: class I SAM-dependent methyltransferase [Candidatus Pristimantibacillus sp.]|nr:class I SAM-dependent methyltransferase [Candidatus Pristimantibacillus sp.]
METPVSSPDIDSRRRVARAGSLLARLTRRGTPAPAPAAPEKPRAFTPDTIVDPVMPEGGRPVADYERLLGFDRSELEGKTVLDLGAGPELKFARELHDAGSTAQVVSLSPDFADERHYTRARRAHPEGVMSTGTGNNLPFPDGIFDRVYALRVMDHLPRDETSFFGFLQEVGRVLADNGEARLGPSNDIINRPILRSNEAFNQYCAQNGITATIERNLDVPATIRVYNEFMNTREFEQPDAVVLRKHPPAPLAQ